MTIKNEGIMNRKETNTAIIAIGMAAAMILGPWRAQAAVPAQPEETVVTRKRHRE